MATAKRAAAQHRLRAMATPPDPVDLAQARNRYPTENGVDANVQSYRRLLAELGTIGQLGASLQNANRECHGTFEALRTRFYYGLELLDAIAPRKDQDDEN